MESIIKYLAAGIFTALRYLVMAGIPFFIFYKWLFKKVVKAKIQDRLASKKEFMHEIVHSLQSSFVLALIGFLLLQTPLRSHTLVYSKIIDYPRWWLPVSFLLCLVIQDSYFYWMHRILHHKKLFAKAHAVHHKSTNPSPWAAYSFHFFEAVTEGLVIVFIVFIIPVHPLVLFLFAIAGFLINVYGHLGFEIMPRWFRQSVLFEIVNSSVYHNLHHHKFKGNYGLYFRCWDRLMKTEHPDYVKTYDRIQEKRFGAATGNGRPLKAAVLLPLLFSTALLHAQIEGKWASKETGDTVEIYKDNNLYYAKAIAGKNKSETAKLSGRVIIVLSHFKKENENSYCCGNIYLPRRNMNAAGTIKQISSNSIKIKGHYGILSYTSLWERVYTM